jgi:hypothetical protein
MSNHWITWQCVACENHVTIAWIVEPGWPSGLNHLRSSLCGECFPAHSAEFFVIDEGVKAQMRELTGAVGERIVEKVPAMEGRPKERFLALGLSDTAARAAAEAWSELRGSLDGRSKRARAAREGNLQRVASACLEAGFTLLTPIESELLSRLAGKTVSLQDSALVQLLVGTPHVPSSLAPRESTPPIEGEHGLFYVLGEEIQLIVPPNAAAILRMQAAGWTDIEPPTTSPLDGSVMRAVFAHEEAEGRYGGIAGLLAEREVSFRDPEVQQILDQCRERRWSDHDE